MKPRSPIPPAFFDLVGASEYVGGALSVRTLRKLITKPGGIPYIRAGRGKILISKVDLDAWLIAKRREPINLDELANKALKELEASLKPRD